MNSTASGVFVALQQVKIGGRRPRIDLRLYAGQLWLLAAHHLRAREDPDLADQLRRADANAWRHACSKSGTMIPVCSSTDDTRIPVKNASQFRIANAWPSGDTPAFMMTGRVPP